MTGQRSDAGARIQHSSREKVKHVAQSKCLNLEQKSVQIIFVSSYEFSIVI